MGGEKSFIFYEPTLESLVHSYVLYFCYLRLQCRFLCFYLHNTNIFCSYAKMILSVSSKQWAIQQLNTKIWSTLFVLSHIKFLFSPPLQWILISSSSKRWISECIVHLKCLNNQIISFSEKQQDYFSETDT